jgi:hypothetical protein
VLHDSAAAAAGAIRRLTSHTAGDDHFAVMAALQERVGSSSTMEDTINIGGKNVSPILFCAILGHLHRTKMGKCDGLGLLSAASMVS